MLQLSSIPFSSYQYFHLWNDGRRIGCGTRGLMGVSSKQRIQSAVNMAWVIDQMMRTLLGPTIHNLLVIMKTENIHGMWVFPLDHSFSDDSIES